MTRLEYRDGERSRAVEVTTLGAGAYRVMVDGAEGEVRVEPLGEGRFRITGAAGASVAEVTAVGTRRFVRVGTLDFVLEREAGARRGSGPAPGGGLDAPMPGVVTRVLVAPGDTVKKGQPLVALEAMKMEHMIRAPRDGRVAKVLATAGILVDGGAPLVEMDDEAR
jgi:3-methylcrotonyl-CoA carboxylase alpha subunit